MEGTERRTPRRQLRQRRLRREDATFQCEPQAITRHGIDESRRVTGEQYSRRAGGTGFDAERSERRHLGYLARARKALAEHRLGRDGVADHTTLIEKPARASATSFSNDADVGDAAGKRRDADVTVAADVHLAMGRQPLDIREIGAKGPPARSPRKRRQTECRRDPASARPSATITSRAMTASSPPFQARRAPMTRPAATDWGTRGEALVERDASGDRGFDERADRDHGE